MKGTNKDRSEAPIPAVGVTMRSCIKQRSQTMKRKIVMPLAAAAVIAAAGASGYAFAKLEGYSLPQWEIEVGHPLRHRVDAPRLNSQ